VVYGLASFQPVLEQLCQDFRIITWDPRGLGRSDPLPGHYDTRDFMEDLRAVIEAAGNRPVVVIGNSRGSTLAAHFATSYPHLVEKLILAGLTPAGGWGRPDAPHAECQDMEFFGRLRAAIAANDWPLVVQTFVPQAAAGEPGLQKHIERTIQVWTQLPQEALQNFFRLEDPTRDVRALLPAIRMPTLVLHGEADRLNPVEMAKWTKEQITGAHFYAFKGRSHMITATAAVEFADVIRHFVRTGRPT
jgi:pimeloyl-ACP methyl ester carboxylesterase